MLFPLARQLKKLARLPLPAGALTIYLNTDLQSPSGRRWPHALRRLWKRGQRLLPRPNAESKALTEAFAGETASLLPAILRRDKKIRSVAVFAPLHSNTPIVLPLPFPLPNQVCFAPHLQLLPLLRTRAAAAHCLVLALDYKHARWGEWWCGHLQWWKEEKAPQIPPRHRAGGWSADRFARHRIEGHLRPFLRKVGLRITRLTKPKEPWLLLGNKEIFSPLLNSLRARTKELLLGTLALDLDSPVPEVRRKISAFLSRKQKEDDRRLVELLTHAEGKQSVLGTQATLRALRKDQLRLLVLANGIAMQGSVCSNCGWLSTSQQRCSICAQPTTAVDDLIEHIAAYALTHNTKLRWVFPHAALLARGGMGGFLRAFPLPPSINPAFV